MTDFTTPLLTNGCMSFGVPRPTTATLPAFPACSTACAAPGKATEVMPQMPFTSGCALRMLCAFSNDLVWLSSAYSVAATFIFGYFFARYPSIALSHATWFGATDEELTTATCASGPACVAI